MEYEAFQIEGGLYNDVLAYSWKDTGQLAIVNSNFMNTVV